MARRQDFRRIGLLIPSSSSVQERDFCRILPDDITLHVARMRLSNVEAESTLRIVQEIESESQKLADVDVDVIVFPAIAPSSRNGIGYDQELIKRISAASGKPATTASSALLEALRVLSAKRIVLGAPWSAPVNETVAAFIEANGVKVLAQEALGLVRNLEIGLLDPQTALDVGRRVNRPGADAVILACGNWSTFSIIDQLERDLGKPVLTTNQVSLWHALKMMNRTPLNGLGVLLREHLNRGLLSGAKRTSHKIPRMSANDPKRTWPSRDLPLPAYRFESLRCLIRGKGRQMRRRDFIKFFGGAALWPLASRAQQPEQTRTVGILLGSTDNPEVRRLLDAFMESFKSLGWIEDRNVRFNIRWTGGSSQNNAIQAQELVRQRPDVIFAAPSNVVIALQKETHSVPIVFANVSDPIAQGVVDNLAHPSANITGFSNLEESLMGKWLQILKEAAPGLQRAVLMIATINAASPIWYRMFEDVAPTLAIEPVSAPIRDHSEIERVIKSVAAEPHTALIVAGDTMLSDPPVRRLIIDLAARYRLPALYGELAFAQDGGLVAYGIDRTDPFRRAASYVDRILRGEKPSDLPVQQPTKFEFVINLKTAKALGLELPLTLQMTADEVIQ